MLAALMRQAYTCKHLIVGKFIREMENIAVDVADNRIDKDLLFEIINSLIYESDYSEELKLKLIAAKSIGYDLF